MKDKIMFAEQNHTLYQEAPFGQSCWVWLTNYGTVTNIQWRNCNQRSLFPQVILVNSSQPVTKCYQFGSGTRSLFRHKPYLYSKFPLAPMGVLAPVSAHAGPSAQPPIGTSRNFPARMSAESPSNISHNPSEVISKVSEVYDDFWIFVPPYMS